MSYTTILVYGWYNKGNIGDELFKEAFQYLFPNYKFIFTDQITVESLKNISTVFIGGGSFLYAEPKINSKALEILKQKNIFYLGVGVEGNIHPIHQNLIKLSKLVAIRSEQSLDLVKLLNNNTIVIPDIIYSLQEKLIISNKINKSILIIPNFTLVPQWNDPHWKHVSWGYFKSEFSQFLDDLVASKFTVNFFPMCLNDEINDEWAAVEIINQMKIRNNSYLIKEIPQNINDLLNLFSRYDYIITQRFHGIILSEIIRVPYITIHHHDKLKDTSPKEGKFIPYYGISKLNLYNSFEEIKKIKFSKSLPIDSNIFRDLARTVEDLVNGG